MIRKETRVNVKEMTNAAEDELFVRDPDPRLLNRGREPFNQETHLRLRKRETKPRMFNRETDPQFSNSEIESKLPNRAADPINSGTEPVFKNSATESMYKNSGTKHMFMKSGTEPMYMNNGTEPMFKNSGTEPMFKNSEIEPMFMNSGTEPMFMNSGTEPLGKESVANYGWTNRKRELKKPERMAWMDIETQPVTINREADFGRLGRGSKLQTDERRAVTDLLSDLYQFRLEGRNYEDVTSGGSSSGEEGSGRRLSPLPPIPSTQENQNIKDLVSTFCRDRTIEYFYKCKINSYYSDINKRKWYLHR